MPSSIKVSELMTKPAISIDKGETVRIAFDLMERNDISHLVVTAEEKVVGVLSMRDIMDGLGSSRFQKIPARRIYVSALMTEPPITINPDFPVAEAISLLIEKGIGSLPVIDDERRPIGILTETDVIKLVNSDDSIRELVKENHPKIMPNERIVHARSIMLERGARILPVVESGRLVGLITESNLAKAFLDVRENIDSIHMDNVVRRIVVEDIMTESPRKLDYSASIDSAKGIFLESGLPGVPVVKQEDKVVGVLERRSLLRLLR